MTPHAALSTPARVRVWPPAPRSGILPGTRPSPRPCHRGAGSVRRDPITHSVGDLWRLQRECIMRKLDFVDELSLRSDIPDFRPGDTVKVHVKVIEGTRSRIQVFQGVVLARSGAGLRETFTVRKVSFGTGVERRFPVHSPIIDRIEVVSRGDVRRAKLYYLRDRRGKAAKIREKRDNA